MEVFVGIDDIRRSLKNPVLTIGNFDGVHRGHQALFDRVKQWAQKLDGESAVMTFHPHPLQVLFPDRGLDFITSHDRKLQLIESCGIDATIIIPFNKEFAQISAHDFVKTILVDKIGIKGIVVGYDYRFGRGREGNIDFLKRKGAEFGFEVDTVAGIHIEDTVVSSTAIRQLIKHGDLREACRLLGRPYEIRGIVIQGFGRGGKKLGFPTANIRMPNQAYPKPGVYAAQVDLARKTYWGAVSLGYNPTFGNNDLSLEVHILDFDEDIYGEELTVRFIERLRDEKKFSGLDELVAQIRADVAKAREVLGSLPNPKEPCSM